MGGWFAYAAASAVLLVGLATGVVALVPGAEGRSVWAAAGVAYLVQLAAFGALVASRKRGRGFMVSWASGILLRFAVVAGVALGLTRTGLLDPASALLSLVGFVFVLVLLEPLFLRLTD